MSHSYTMKELRVTFEDEDYPKLLKAKGDRSWREFILTLIKESKTK